MALQAKENKTCTGWQNKISFAQLFAIMRNIILILV